MNVRIKVCLFVLDSEKNENIRKNDIKKIKVLVDGSNDLPRFEYKKDNIKDLAKEEIFNLIGSKVFHLEQVYTSEFLDGVEIIYLAITNIENIINLKKNYKLVDFCVNNNSEILFANKKYKYKTLEIEENNNIEYFHEIKEKDETVKNTLYALLICYKTIRSKIDITDIIFKFFGKTFTLEDVRIVYEIIKECGVDKSNFRKKIIKYCEKVDEKDNSKNGFRPSQKYRFKPLKGDLWI